MMTSADLGLFIAVFRRPDLVAFATNPVASNFSTIHWVLLVVPVVVQYRIPEPNSMLPLTDFHRAALVVMFDDRNPLTN